MLGLLNLQALHRQTPLAPAVKKSSTARSPPQGGSLRCIQSLIVSRALVCSDAVAAYCKALVVQSMAG
jgi:hypothetical protein